MREPRDVLEHLSDDRSTHRIDDGTAPTFTRPPLLKVSEGRQARAVSHLRPGFLPALHIESPVVVLELCLRAEDHQEKLLIRVISELLSVRPDIREESLIHEIND